ncbi:hypothetical protein Efla_001932 [Eimeria flavescens]
MDLRCFPDSHHCYKWQAVYSDAEFHDESVAICLCTARQIRPYPAANEAYCNYVSTIQKLPEEAQPLAIPPAVSSILQDCPAIRKQPTALPPPRNHQHAIPLYHDGEPQLGAPVFFVSKKNGELRPVVDYRGLNSQTQPDKIALSLIDVLIDKMSKPKVFSRLDLRNGFTRFRSAVPLVWRIIILIFPHIFQRLRSLYTASPAPQPLFWSPPCRSAVANIKYLLVNSPVLSIFDGSLPTRITCDASSSGIGEVLEQQHPGDWYPTQFLSRTLSKPETNYPVIDKEWLAVIYPLTKWRHYLQQRFCILADHKPLVSLLSKSSTQLQDRRSARSRQDPVKTHSPAAYALALTAPETHARDALMSDIRRYRAGDPLYMEKPSRLSAPQVQDKIPPRDDKFYFCKTRLDIPKYPVLRTRLIAEHPDSCYAGHLGRDKTTEFSSRGFCWPSLSQDVEAYVKSCDICLRNKVTRHPVAPPTNPMTAPSRWHTVSLDVLGPFLTNCPATPGSNICILVFIDKLKKMLHVAASPEQLSAENAAKFFIEHVSKHHRLPE